MSPSAETEIETDPATPPPSAPVQPPGESAEGENPDLPA